MSLFIKRIAKLKSSKEKNSLKNQEKNSIHENLLAYANQLASIDKVTLKDEFIKNYVPMKAGFLIVLLSMTGFYIFDQQWMQKNMCGKYCHKALFYSNFLFVANLLNFWLRLDFDVENDMIESVLKLVNELYEFDKNKPWLEAKLPKLFNEESASKNGRHDDRLAVLTCIEVEEWGLSFHLTKKQMSVMSESFQRVAKNANLKKQVIIVSLSKIESLLSKENSVVLNEIFGRKPTI